jgi:hypothetical protein
MADEVNRADVIVNLQDVYRRTITDEVEITFYNQRVQSLSQQFKVRFKGKPEVLPGVPAFPVGLAEVFISPPKYRYKSVFSNVFGGAQNLIEEDFFVEPDKAWPKLIDFADLSQKSYSTDLLRILKRSGINESAWNSLERRNRATILNLSAKMFKETTKDGQPIILKSIALIRRGWTNGTESGYSVRSKAPCAAIRASTSKSSKRFPACCISFPAPGRLLAETIVSRRETQRGIFN